MTDPIDKYLDGTLERSALTPEERAQADVVEQAIDETRAFVESRPAPDLTARVMRQIGQQAISPAGPAWLDTVKRLADTFWKPRPVSFEIRPAFGLIAAAAMVALVVYSPYSMRAPADTTFVQFRLQVAEASDVRLAGSFTNWQPTYELHESAPGNWTITLPLSLGVHDYVFVVDGQRWVADPYAPHVDDGFGGTNSRIALLPPDTPRS